MSFSLKLERLWDLQLSLDLFMPYLRTPGNSQSFDLWKSDCSGVTVEQLNRISAGLELAPRGHFHPPPPWSRAASEPGEASGCPRPKCALKLLGQQLQKSGGAL